MSFLISFKAYQYAKDQKGLLDHAIKQAYDIFKLQHPKIEPDVIKISWAKMGNEGKEE